jgi:hypothetical protein
MSLIKLMTMEDIESVAQLYNSEKSKMSDSEILTCLREDFESTYIQEMLVLFKMERNVSVLDILQSAQEDSEFYNNLYPYIKKESYSTLSFFINNDKETYLKLRKHDNLFYKQYAQSIIAPFLSNLESKDKILLIKELSNQEVIKAKIVSLNVIVFDDLLVECLFSELNLFIDNYSKKIISVMDIVEPVEQDIVLKESCLEWELENKTLSSINNWVQRAKEFALISSLNVITNPKVHKLAVGALVIGVAFGSADAMADMSNAADTLVEFGDSLAESIGNIEGSGECNLGTTIVNKSTNLLDAQVNFGDYRIDVHVTGIDSTGFKSSDISVRIARLKSESNCVLDLDDAKKIAKVVRKIVAKK